MDLLAAISFLSVIRRSLFFKVLYDAANSKVECQTDSCFRYKSFKFCSHTVAVAVHLKIFETYISKVKRSSTKDFVDNVVDISRNPNAGQKKNKSTQKRKGKANKKPEKVMKHVDPCDACGSPVQQPKQLYPPPNGYIVTLLKFFHRNVSTCYSCGAKFYHQGYPDAPGDLIVVSKTKRVFVNPVTHERTQSNEFSNVYFHFNFACIFAHDRCFAPQLIQIEPNVKMCLEEVHVITLCSAGIML